MTRTVMELVEGGRGGHGLSHQLRLGNVHRDKRHDDSAEAPTGSKISEKEQGSGGSGLGVLEGMSP